MVAADNATDTTTPLKPDYIETQILVAYLIICVVIDIVIFVGVLYKKDELRNSFKNTSFSKISNWILNMVGVNMMIGAIISTFIFEELIAIFNFCNNYNSGRSCDESAQKYNDIMDNMYTLFIMLVRIISITQIYEWFVMRMILLWQHKKDLRQAILDLNDPEKRRLFRRRELKYFGVYVVALMVIVLK